MLNKYLTEQQFELCSSLWLSRCTRGAVLKRMSQGSSTSRIYPPPQLQPHQPCPPPPAQVTPTLGSLHRALLHPLHPLHPRHRIWATLMHWVRKCFTSAVRSGNVWQLTSFFINAALIGCSLKKIPCFLGRGRLILANATFVFESFCCQTTRCGQEEHKWTANETDHHYAGKKNETNLSIVMHKMISMEEIRGWCCQKRKTT